MSFNVPTTHGVMMYDFKFFFRKLLENKMKPIWSLLRFQLTSIFPYMLERMHAYRLRDETSIYRPNRKYCFSLLLKTNSLTSIIHQFSNNKTRKWFMFHKRLFRLHPHEIRPVNFQVKNYFGLRAYGKCFLVILLEMLNENWLTHVRYTKDVPNFHHFFYSC